jgi:hypothetical protein
VSVVSSSIGSGCGATPRRCSLSAQNGWSTRTGTEIAGAPSWRPGRPPISGHVHRRGPVWGSGDHRRAEAVADRPVLRRARRRLGGGRDIEPGAQPPQNGGVERAGPGEHSAARGEVVRGRQVLGTGPARWRELPGGDPGREIDTEARDAEAVGDQPAQRGRAEGGEQNVGAGGRGGQHALAQLVEERGEDRSRGLRGGGGGPCAYELDRVAGKGPVLQTARTRSANRSCAASAT